MRYNQRKWKPLIGWHNIYIYSIHCNSTRQIHIYIYIILQVIPALWSFCAYAAVGVLATFIFQTTFLVSCLAYDDVRVSDERNACCCCIVHTDDVPRPCSNTLIMQTVFEKFYAPVMIKLPTKVTNYQFCHLCV